MLNQLRRPLLQLLESSSISQRLAFGAVKCGTSRFYPNSSKKMGCSTSKTFKIQEKSQTKQDMASISSLADAYVEADICKETDIGENEMKVFDVQDGAKVLLIKQKGRLSALGYKCTHYGAPLVNGALGDGRIRCQWHGACFNVTTGDIEDFPGLDSLPCHQVTVEKGNVKIRALKSELESNKRVKKMSVHNVNDETHAVIIGGGPSGAVCAETLRQEGFAGRITVAAKERHLPYDRIKINKAMDTPIKSLELRKADFYQNNDIHIISNTEALSVNLKANEVTVQSGSKIKFSMLYIATGSKPRKADIPGADLKNVYTIREYDDCAAILPELKMDKEVVILGSSFIGMEVAAFCWSKVGKVTIVSKDSVPFQAALGEEVGAGVLKLFHEKEMEFVPNNGLQSIMSDDKAAVSGVVLKDGRLLKADLVIMGIGSTLNTKFLEDSGILLNEDGSVEVDEYLQTNVPNVFAGGDIAHAPVWSSDNRKATIGHFGLAEYHGRIAAKNMLKQNVPLRNVPFFWTTILGKGIRYAGYGRYDSILYSGEPRELKFVAFYLNGEDVVAVSSCQFDPIVSKYAEYVQQGKKLTKSVLMKSSDLLGWANEVP